MEMKKILTGTMAFAAVLGGCTDIERDKTGGIVPATDDRLYILNEGQMGLNNATIDFYDFSDGSYTSDAFTAANPDVAFELGDTGNDIAIHDGKLWAVINGSGLVEIMDAATLKHIKYIEIPTPRDIAFCGDYAYVTSWSGAYYGGENRLGAVYRIDINSLSEAGSIDVGYQPEGIAAAEGKIYVANSGGVTDGYDNRLSIIDADSFTLERNVEIAANICDIAVDGRGMLWISSPGDYMSVHSGIYTFNPTTGKVAGKDIRVSSMYSNGSLIYILGNENEWDYTPGSGMFVLTVIDQEGGTVARTILDQSGAAEIEVPYGIWASNDGGTIFISDSGDYINPGTVYMLDSSLKLVRTFSAGVNPGHFAFLSL